MLHNDPILFSKDNLDMYLSELVKRISKTSGLQMICRNRNGRWSIHSR